MKKILQILIIIFLGSCTNKSTVAEKFINNFKGKNLNSLFNVVIEARNERDGNFHYYYSYTFRNKDTLMIPSFEFYDSFVKKDSSFHDDIYKLCKYDCVDNEKAFSYAKNYASKLQEIYNELGVINSISNPNLGRFIKFTLNPSCTVYYLEDSTTLTTYWKEHFSRIKKVDNKWYYECK